MRALVALTILLTGLILAPLRAEAQANWIDSPFDPSVVSREDLATIQAALAFSRDFPGYVDGIWNETSRKAFSDWSRRNRNRDTPIFRDIDDLVMTLEDERVASNWQIFHDDQVDVSYLYPFDLLKEEAGSNGLKYLSEDRNFSLNIHYQDRAGMQVHHDWFAGKAPSGVIPWQHKGPDTWITSTEINDGFFAFARSDLKGNTWMTVSIVITPQYLGHLNLLTASWVKGSSVAALMWTKGGIINGVINGEPLGVDPGGPKDQIRVPELGPPGGGTAVAEAPPVTPGPPAGAAPGGGVGAPPAGSGGTAPPAGLPPATPPLGTTAPGAPGQPVTIGTPAPGAVAGASPTPEAPPAAGGGLGTAPPGAAATTPPAAAKPSEAPRVTGTLKGSGSGFYIAPGTLLTAAHVIDGCSAVSLVDGTPLEILAADLSLDVAALKGGPANDDWLRLSALEVPKLGEPVTVLGYPYYTSLEQGLTVTSGVVSALRGSDGSSNRVMLTAPVQPGNSGGPLLNRKGAVIGIVVSRMDDMAMLKETGSLPQNMNFAVPSGPLLTFLAQNRISRPQGEGAAGSALSEEVPEGMVNVVVPLYCYQ